MQMRPPAQVRGTPVLRSFILQSLTDMTHLRGQDPDAGKDWGQEENGATEDKMVGWHHQLNGHECEQTPGDSERQGTCCAAVHGVTKNWTWLSDWTTTVSPLSSCTSSPWIPRVQGGRLASCREDGRCLWQCTYFRPRTWGPVPMSTLWQVATMNSDTDLMGLGFLGCIIRKLELSAILWTRTFCEVSGRYVF